MANPTGWKPSMEKDARTPARGRRASGPGGATRGLVHEEPLVFEHGSPGRVRRVAPAPRAAASTRRASSPPRSSAPASTGMPEISELEVVRHFTRLSSWNYGIDTGFYPLGSCTMKYNPKSSEALARLPGFADVHPLAPPELVPGRARADVPARAGALGDRRLRRDHAHARGRAPRASCAGS